MDCGEFQKVQEIITYLNYYKEEASAQNCKRPIEYWKFLCIDLLRHARMSLPKDSRLAGNQRGSIKRVEPLKKPLPEYYMNHGIDKFELG